MRHVYECQMRRASLHGDTISNVAFVDYIQEARLDLLRHHDTSPTPNPGEGLVVVNTVVEYLSPLRLPLAPLFVAVWSSPGAGGVVHARLRALHRLARRPAGARPRDDRADAVRLHGRAPAPAGTRGTRDAHRQPGAVFISDRVAPRGAEDWGAAGVVERQVTVRFSDVDLLGHVNNLRYLDYAQIAQGRPDRRRLPRGAGQRHGRQHGRAQRDRLRRPDEPAPRSRNGVPASASSRSRRDGAQRSPYC